MMSKVVRQLKASDRKNLYVGLSSDVYNWIHNKSSELKISKAMFVDSILSEAMNNELSKGGTVLSKIEVRRKNSRYE